MDDEFARWAREQAPGVLARAEDEAVRVLRDALVAAALAQRRPDPASVEPARAPAPDTTAVEEPAGELVWAYCVMRAEDPAPTGLPGVYGSALVEREEATGLAALVSVVPAAEFAAEPLRQNLNDLPWLERVARAHEAVLDATLQETTIVPLRMCTLYESRQGVRDMLEREQATLRRSLETLEGRLEWAVKVTCDRERLLVAAQDTGVVSAPAQDFGPTGEGGAYMQRRRAQRDLRREVDELAADIAAQVHARLQDWALDAVTRPPQSRELAGYQGEMLLNGAYLVERSRADELGQLIEELQERYESLGITIELTGPWSPYNFVSRGDSSEAA